MGANNRKKFQVCAALRNSYLGRIWMRTQIAGGFARHLVFAAWRERRTAAALLVVAGVVASGYLGLLHHPDVDRPTSTEAQRAIAESLQVTQPADDQLSGDFVIERYYALDRANGRRAVLDICKGRISNVVVSLRGDWTDYTYDLIVDRSGLETRPRRLTAFIREVAPVEADESAAYLGLVVASGTVEVLSLNYDGTLPEAPTSFRWEDREGVFAFLSVQEEKGVPFTHLLRVDGNNYLLTNTDLSPQLRDLLGMKQGTILAQLLLVDRTSRASSAAFLRASQ